MKKIKALLFLIVVILATDCSSSKSGIQSNVCDTHGIVVDMSGLDGCKWMLVTDAGNKLLPQKWPDGFEPKDKLSVSFHFTQVKDAMSVCMAEDMVVTVDCIEPIATTGKPVKPTCYNTVNPMEVDWMRVAMVKNGTNLIEKYHYLDKYAYLFKGVNLDNDLYDCQGNLLCSYRETEQNACSQQLGGLGGGTVIWRGKE